MKRLTLLRHAKSDWDDTAQRDFDRGLNARGRKGAELIGKHIRDHGVKWDRLIASPAVRVKLTLEGALPDVPVIYDQRLYLASFDTIVETIEAGEKNVSLTTLDLIAEALGVAFSTLIQAPDQRDPGRIEELAWAGEFPQSRAVLLGSSTARREVELWEWTLAPGECYVSEADADGWNRLTHLFGTLTNHELLQLDPAPLLTRLFPEELISLAPGQALHHAGERNWDKVRNMVRGLGKDEVDAILREHGAVVIHDELSNQEYRFSPDEALALFAADSTEGRQGQTLH